MKGESRGVVNHLFSLLADSLHFGLEGVEVGSGLCEFVMDVGTLREFFTVDDLEIAEVEEGDVEFAQSQ